MVSSQEDNKKQQIKRKLKKENSKLTANIERINKGNCVSLKRIRM